MGVVLTEIDKKILRDFAKLDTRIEKLYAQWKKKYFVIAAVIDILNRDRMIMHPRKNA